MPLSLPIDRSFHSEDLAACRALLRGGSRSFHAASLLLPARVRDPASALYAFCRVADDAIDRDGGAAAALAALHDRLDRIYRGTPSDHPADRAFAAVVERHHIPRALPDALLEGFAWDLEARRYDTIDDLHGYAARVAGCVGVMMTLVMGRREPSVLARACDLGMAMQLTNIARDVGEDARAGRLYLPQQWLREAGIDPDSFLARPAFSRNLGTVVQRLLDHADGLYARAADAISALPADCRPAIHAARVLYAEIGRELEREGLDSVSNRAVVPPLQKLAVLLRSCTAPLARPQFARAPVSAPAAFLLEAVAGLPHAIPEPAGAMPWHRIRDRAIWTIELFERLERRSQMERAG